MPLVISTCHDDGVHLLLKPIYRDTLDNYLYLPDEACSVVAQDNDSGAGNTLESATRFQFQASTP